MGIKKWNDGDNKRIGMKRERTARVLEEFSENQERPVVLVVNFQTGEFQRFDSSSSKKNVSLILEQIKENQAA
jgi:hypothetical protein